MELETKDYIHFKLKDQEIEFEGHILANKALPGDIVSWNNGCNIIKRKTHYIIGTLELNSKTKYGMTSKGYPLYLFVPFDRSYPHFIVGSSHKDCSKNCIGIINFDSWNDSLPRGSLIRILGQSDNLAVQEEALLLTYHPYKMPKNLEPELETTNFNSRIRCPNLTFNIDPDGCMDIDDVISLTESELWITIADVAERISENSEIDIYASQQGQTVYKNGKAIQPMLPYELSENRCSLQPGVLRPGISLIIKFTNSKPRRIESMNWCLSCVVNKKAYDYDNFKERGSEDGIDISIIQELAEEILGEHTDDPHRWIEAFMLKYNIETAKILYNRGQGILRKHMGKDEKKWEEYIKWNKDLAFLASHAAVYCNINDPLPTHIGIGSIYCHASSPIRRYSDLVNQRILKGIMCGTSNDCVKKPQIDWLNKRQKDCKRYERDLFFIQNLGKGQLNAIVLSEKKIWVENWKRIVTWKNNSVPGSKIILDYFVNQNSRHWKERIVFSLSRSKYVNIDCQE